ncbi:MAG: hypothetical protein IPI00_15020 [Flavobacteriales bacterium]|nr:hypothetical protein [Flavobacteriales bacterium]MBK6945325.1 hypothetical protein [Flavobacteriales bacterium]MBK7241437.1 hypothetical protein [Flavobacteriales bacterium]MBK9535117.1 hypothetical protein [Flavobacteriales bacterium]MBP9139477.1 hypothetical protein [Flavobacteriales bacterium]
MVTNRIALFLLFLLTSLFSSAQFPVLPSDTIVDLTERYKNRIQLTGDFDYNANSLLNELPLALLQGGYIDRVLRQRSLDAVRKKDNNRAGYVLSTRLSWKGQNWFLGHRNWRPLISFSHQDQMGLKFADDLFDVTFFGNASFEGQRADLGPTAYKQTRFQTAGFGIQFRETASYVRLDIVNGQSLTDINAKWAGLFTGEDGRILRATINGKFLQSDTAGSELGRKNGLGAAVSGGWSTELQRTELRTFLAFEVINLGFVHWNGNAVNLEKDTVILYDGIRVTNILDLDNALTGTAQLQDTFGLSYRTEGTTTLLPFQIRGAITTQLNARWTGTFTLDQRYLPGYVPQISASSTRRLGAHALLGMSISYGGFGGLRVGLASKIRIGQHVLVTVGTPHLPGFLMGSMRGAGAQFGLVVGF